MSPKDFRQDFRFRLVRVINKFFIYHPFTKSIGFQYFIAKLILPKFSGKCIVNTIYDFNLIIDVVADHKLDLRGSMARNIYYLGTYESASIYMFIKLINRGLRNVVDVGANIGLYTITACSTSAKSIIAYEPIADSCCILRENVSLNHCNASSIRQIAINKRKQKTIQMYPCLTSPEASSLYPDKHNEYGDPINVDASTLDGNLSLSKVNIIKIDVEGAEFDVLSGGKSLLSRNEPVIIYEHRPWNKDKNKIVNFLQTIGYRFFYSTQTRHYISPLKELLSATDLPDRVENIFAVHSDSIVLDLFTKEIEKL